MRYLRFLLFVALLGLSADVLASRSVSAQSDEDILPKCDTDEAHAGKYWDGVCQPVYLPEVLTQNPILPDVRLLPYGVTFLQPAPESEDAPLVGSTQRIPNTEYMIVIVKRGCFALDVSQPDSVVVSSPRHHLTILGKEELTAEDVTVFFETEGAAPAECVAPTEGTAVPESAASPDSSTIFPCEVSCVINPATPVLLAEGDVAFAEPGAICLWCLLHAHARSDGVAGGLEVLALVDPDQPELFSWNQAWLNAPLAEEATPSASSGGTSAIRALAFNPQSSRCHGS